MSASAVRTGAAGRWVLLRGLTRGQGHWGDLPQRLAKASAAEVICLDLPGNGTRWLERSPARIEAMADDCQARLPPAPGPTRVLALSLGGMVAVSWATRWPAALDGLVLVGSSAGAGNPPWQRLRPMAWPRLGALLMARHARRREQHVLELTSGQPDAQAGVLDAWEALTRSQPVAAGNALRQLWAAARWRGPSQAPPLPVLLLAGAADRLVSPACSQRLATRWQLPLALHPWAGHDVALDDPDWLVAQVLAWTRAQS